MTPIPKPTPQPEPKPEMSQRPVIVRQDDDTVVVFGPDLDDINLCDDPC